MKGWSSFLGLIGVLLLAGTGLSWLVNKELALTFQILSFVGTSLVFFYIYHHIDAIIDALGSRSARYSGFAVTLIVLMGVVLGFINYIALKHPKRYDTTETQSFTLSPQTLEVVKGLKGTVEIKTFFMMDSPAKPKFKDLVDSYRTHTDKINVTYIDPERDPLAAKQYGITMADSVLVASGVNEKTLQNVTEEVLTNALINVTRETQKKICFLEGHGEKSTNNSEKEGLSQAKEVLEKQSFAVQSVTLFQTNKIPEDCRVLVIAGPERPLMDPEKPLIDQWVLAGGRLIFMIDPNTDPALAEYVKTWGVTPRNDLVVDPVAMAFLKNAAVPMAVPAGTNKIVENLQGAAAYLPLARSLELAATAPHEGYFETLLRTAGDDQESRAWGETDPAILEPGSSAEPKVPTFDEKDNPGPLSLGVLLNIPLKGSAPEATPKPEGEKAEGEKGEGEKPADSPKERQAMVVVFGDSDFASNAQFYATGSINGDLFLNAISYMAEEEDLLAIRPRDKAKETLSMSQGQADLIFYLTLMFMPAAPMLLGFYTFFKKRNM